MGWGCSAPSWEPWSPIPWVTEELLCPRWVLVGHRFPGGRAVSQCTVNCRAGVCGEDTADEPLQSSKSKYCLAAEEGGKSLNHPNQIVSAVWPGSGDFSFFFIFFFSPCGAWKTNMIWRESKCQWTQFLLLHQQWNQIPNEEVNPFPSTDLLRLIRPCAHKSGHCWRQEGGFASCRN